MNADSNPSQPEFSRLPPGVKIRKRKFPKQPASEFVPVGERQSGAASATPFIIRWADQDLGVTAVVREADNGRLSADVFCSDAGLLGKAAVSVGLVGKKEWAQICKTIPLNIPANDGCAGLADFGFLADAIKELGSQIGIIVILGLDP